MLSEADHARRMMGAVEAPLPSIECRRFEPANETRPRSLSFQPMPEFCDVAVPVPLDMVFTYRVLADAAPVVGGRVLVPFRQQRMTGIVVELHDRKPSVTTKNILSVLDSTPVLDEQLLQLGRWIADYYLAPIGDVFRSMLPLNAEFKRSIGYRLTEQGQMALHLAGMSGSSARSKRTPEEQEAEFRVLDYLAGCESTPPWKSKLHDQGEVPAGGTTADTSWKPDPSAPARTTGIAIARAR